MKKQILNLGKALSKSDQKQINGGGSRWPNLDCDSYNGPIFYDSNSCAAFFALPLEHQGCVMVSYLCFPR